MTKNQQHIPHGAWPRLLGHAEVSAYLGVSPNSFDNYIRSKLTERKIGKRVLWDRREVDALFDTESDKDEAINRQTLKQAALAQL